RVAYGVAPPSAPCTHRYGSPRRQNWHPPHDGDQLITTGSPTRTFVTPSPTSTTVPAPSCPSTAGTCWRSVPLDSDRSEWQTPAAASLTRTFPVPAQLPADPGRLVSAERGDRVERAAVDVDLAGLHPRRERRRPLRVRRPDA